jgi:hypothetical protein
LGYDGLEGGALVIEFDFHNDTDEPTYPHLSIQYTSKPQNFSYSQTVSSHHRYSIAHKYLSKETLQDERIHNVRVVYDPDF